MKPKTIFLLTILMVYALGIAAQSVLTTDAMIRVAEQKNQCERMAADGKYLSPAQQSALTLVVKVADEQAADTYARLRELGVTIRGRIGQQTIVQVPIDKVETIARMDGILRVDVGHRGELKTDVTREVTNVNAINGNHPSVPLPLTGKGVTVCVMDMGIDFNHPAFKDAQGRSRIKCVYNMMSDKGRKFVYDDPVAGTIEFPGSVFDTPELIAKLVYDTKMLYHGSHTVGIAAGSLSPQGFGGMAPDADIVYLAMMTLVTEDEVDSDTGSSAAGSSLTEPDPNANDETNQLIEQYLAFASAYAQQNDQPMVFSASLGSHMGPHDGTGTVPEAISALSQYAIPVFASGNEGGKGFHVQYQFDADKPSFSTGLAAFIGGLDEEEDPDHSFLWFFSNSVRGYTRPGQGGEIGVRINVIARDDKMNVVECAWSSPLISATVGGPSQMMTINSADYPDVQNYFRGKVYVGLRTAENGRLELNVVPSALCKEVRDVKHYALSITVTGSPGAAVDLWQSGFRFFPYVGEGYIAGDDIISGSDWTSTTDVISVGAWCANTTQRTNAQGQQDTQSPEETLGDIGSFSSYGQMFNGVTQPMVCAPGVNVVSAWNRYYDAANGGPTSYIDTMTWQGFPYGSTTGTSMACPAVAGIVALWLQAHPELTLADVKDVLANSCDNDEFTAKNPIRWGYGKVNAKRGLEYIQDHATGIVDITTMPPGGSQPPVWRGASVYTLDGRRLSGKPSQKGVYINKGIKVVMK